MKSPGTARNRWSRVVVAALAALGCLLAACSSGPGQFSPSPTAFTTIPVGSSAGRLVVHGQSRHYRVYRPRQLSRRASLVLMIHGGGGSAAHAEREFGWDAAAKRYGFVVAYPQGSGRIHAWNVGGGCCGVPARRHVNDVAFVRSLVRTLRRKVSIDPRRIYAAGVSNGGMLAYTLACRTRLFAAIGPVSATMLGSCTRPARVSVLHIHGLQDTRVRFHGGRGSGRARINGPPVPSVISAWRRTDRCTRAHRTRSKTVTRSTARCPGGRAVELITIANAGHGWPGAASVGGRSRTDRSTPSRELDATNVLARFFREHPKPRH